MRGPRGTRRRPVAIRGPGGVRAIVRRAAPIAVAILLSGCAAIAGAARAYYGTTPAGVEQRDWRLRRVLAVGSFDTALRRVSSRDDDAPGDRLLRSLYEGLVAYYAGDYARSASRLRAADELAEDRYTKSISRNALALASNDRVLPYVPGHNERLLVHYYAALGFLRRNDLAGAAVEARRMSQLLEQFDETTDPSDLSVRTFLRYFAGAVFEAAGERNDADVAYRNARARVTGGMLPEARRDEGEGEVVVLIERGFVAHRVEETIVVELGGSDRDRYSHRDSLNSSTGMASLGPFLRQLDAAEDRGVYRSGSRRLHHDRERDSVEYVLKVSWPVFLPPVRHRESIEVSSPGGGSPVPATLIGDFSEGIVSDYRRARPTIFARTVARALIKYAAAEQAEKKKGEKGKIIANLAGALLERADTRSWHMLPADVAMARITLPAGQHRLSLRVGGGADPDSGNAIDLGNVEVKAGKLGFVTTRIWPDLHGAGTVSQRY